MPTPTPDAAYWEDCYQRGEMHWDKGAPSPGLVDFLATQQPQTPATVCVPGCGTGCDALAWARAGFQVTGLDIAPSAVRLAAERAKQAKLPVHLLQGDFLEDPPPERFDWVWEHTLFCAIPPSRRDAYLEAVLRWLKPAGTYLAVNYIITDEEDGPPFSTTRDELLRRFQPFFTLRDSWIPRSYPNREGCELMLWWERNP